MSQLNIRAGRKAGVFLGLVAMLFAILFAGAPAKAADDPSTYAYTIAGTLLNNEKPVVGVTVTASLDSFKSSVKSDDSGAWLIMVPKAGVYDVTSIHIGTAPSPSSSANVVTTARQLATFDSARVAVTST